MAFNIGLDERVSIVGKTGSGKTTLARGLLSWRRNQSAEWDWYPIFVLDTKQQGDFDGLGFTKVTRLRQLPKVAQKNRLIIYAPIPEEKNTRFYDGFFRWIRAMGGPSLTYIDEMADIAKGNSVSYEYSLLMKQGRGDNMSIWGATQFPVDVPRDFLGAAEHFFVFDLKRKSDRERAAELIGDEAKPRVKEKYGFWYYNDDMRTATYFSNEQPLKLAPLLPGMGGSEQGGGDVNSRYIWGILVLALLMAVTIPLWKLAARFLASKIPALGGAANWVAQG